MSDTRERKDDQENPVERRRRMISLYIVHFCMMVFSLGYSIVLTGVLPYLRRLTSLEEGPLLELFGWMVAINPIGQFLFSPFVGWLSSKIGSIRITCIVTCLLYILGNVIYSCLSLIPDTQNGWYRAGVMLFGRLLVGIGTSNQAPIRAYISAATYNHERNLHISILSLFQTVGFMIGPALQAALVPLGCSDDYHTGVLRLDMYTVTGWISAGLCILSMITFMPGIFTEHSVAEKEAAQINEESETKTDIMSLKPDLPPVFALVFGFFVFQFNFILLETIGTPLCMQQLEWEESDAIRNLGIIMSVGAVGSVICYGSVPLVTKKFDERIIYVVCGMFPLFLARILILPIIGFPTPTIIGEENSTTTASPNLTMFGNSFYEEDSQKWRLSEKFDYYGVRNIDCDESVDSQDPGCPFDWCEYTPAITAVQFYIHYAMSSLAFPYCTAICQAVLSKVLGPRPQGLWMGILTSAGSLARIAGPIFVSEIYKELGTYWTYGICAFSVLLSILCTVVTYKRMVPMETRINPDHDANKEFEENSRL